MTPEEFQKIKEAEKAHLRELKKLKEAVRLLERQKKVTGAVTDMTSSIEKKMDEHREAVDRLALDTARAEARLELALDSVDESTSPAHTEMLDDETLRKERARELIRQMKGGSEPSPGNAGPTPAEGAANRSAEGDEPDRSGSARPTTDSSAEETDESENNPPVPEKTIGRMKP
jgi:hypothetical protein